MYVFDSIDFTLTPGTISDDIYTAKIGRARSGHEDGQFSQKPRIPHLLFRDRRPFCRHEHADSF